MKNIRKIIISILLAVISLFSSACNSIVLSGNLHVEAFDPPPIPKVPGLSAAYENQEIISYRDNEKYDIEGKEAFYIPPDNESEEGLNANPEDILNFKVLGYTKEGSLVYAYCKKYRGEAGSGSEIVNEKVSRRGTADLKSAVNGDKENNNENNGSADSAKKATVIMSYNPDTREYRIFASLIEDIGEDKSQENNLIAMKLDKGYMIFMRNTVYVFSETGEEVFLHDYSQIISQEIGRVALEESGKSSGYTYTVTDVSMDSQGYIYINVTVDINTSSSGANDFEKYDSIKDGGSSNAGAINLIITAYNAVIGGEDARISFKSKQLNAGEQEALYKSIDAKSFESADEAVKAAEESGISKIKSELVKDKFEIFHTENEKFSMQLAGYPNVGDLKLDFVDGSGNHSMKESSILKLYVDSEEIFKKRKESGEFLIGDGSNYTGRDKITDSNTLYKYIYAKFSNEKGILYRMPSKDREIAYNTAKKAMAMMGKGDKELLYASGATGDAGYLYIPPVTPEEWDKEKLINKNPLSAVDENGSHIDEAWYREKGYPLPILFAYKKSGNNSLSFNRYAEIYIDGALGVWRNGKPDNTAESFKAFEPYIKVLEESELERSFSYMGEGAFTPEYANDKNVSISIEKYDEEADDTADDEDSDEAETYVVKEKVKVPVSYQLIFPKNTFFYWVESVKTNDSISAVSGKGALYYGSDNGKSHLIYHDGSKRIIDENGVEGNAVDAGEMLYGGNGFIYFLTDKGLRLYSPYNEFAEINDIIYKEGYSLIKEDKQTENASIITGDSLCIISDSELLLSANTGGLYIYNIPEKVSYKALKGCFYKSFKTEDGSKSYISVGYMTDKYTYSSQDIVRAKCYKLNGSDSEFKSGIIRNYLEYLRDRMLQIEYVDFDRKLDETERSRYEQAKTLIYASETEAYAEYGRLLDKLGYSSSESLKAILDELRLREQTKLSGIEELLALTGAYSKLSLNADEYRETRGKADKAANVNELKHILVGLLLREEIISAQSKESAQRLREYLDKSISAGRASAESLENSVYFDDVLSEAASINKLKREELELALNGILLKINPDARLEKKSDKNDFEKSQEKSIFKETYEENE